VPALIDPIEEIANGYNTPADKLAKVTPEPSAKITVPKVA
jgi:hypothetical protein